MTEQEMQARIQELEEENLRLKHKKKRVSLLEQFGRVYPWLGYNDADHKLSGLIRAVCFHMVEKPRKHKGSEAYWDSKYLLETKDMTDEQKSRYSEIAGKLISVLDEYEAITDTERFQNIMRSRNWDEWYRTHYGAGRDEDAGL